MFSSPIFPKQIRVALSERIGHHAGRGDNFGTTRETLMGLQLSFVMKDNTAEIKPKGGKQ
jgi:hypothetical protein